MRNRIRQEDLKKIPGKLANLSSRQRPIASFWLTELNSAISPHRKTRNSPWKQLRLLSRVPDCLVIHSSERSPKHSLLRHHCYVIIRVKWRGSSSLLLSRRKSWKAHLVNLNRRYESTVSLTFGTCQDVPPFRAVSPFETSEWRLFHINRMYYVLE